MYSLIAYFIAIKVIDIIVDGFDESKAVFIISSSFAEVSEVIQKRLGRNATMIEGVCSKEGDYKIVLYVIVSRLEVAKLKLIVHEVDENALITVGNVEVSGKGFRKLPIHKAFWRDDK